MGSMDWRMDGASLPSSKERRGLPDNVRKDGAAKESAIVAQTIQSERGDAIFYEVHSGQVTPPNIKKEVFDSDGIVLDSDIGFDNVSDDETKIEEPKIQETTILRSSALKPKQHHSYVWLLIFAAGLIMGTLFVNCLAADQMSLSGAWMAETVDKMLDFNADVGFFIHILVKRGGIFIFLAGITLLLRRSLLLYLSTAYFSFCFGVVISSMTVAYGTKGLLQLLEFLLPHYLLYVPAYILLIRWAGIYVGSRSKGISLKTDVSSLFLMTAMVILGCVLECYVNPIWITFFESF